MTFGTEYNEVKVHTQTILLPVPRHIALVVFIMNFPVNEWKSYWIERKRKLRNEWMTFFFSIDSVPYAMTQDCALRSIFTLIYDVNSKEKRTNFRLKTYFRVSNIQTPETVKRSWKAWKNAFEWLVRMFQAYFDGPCK